MSSANTELHKFILALDSLREEDDQMPVQQARVLLAVALQPGITFEGLEKEVAISHASAWRAIAKMSKWYKVGTPGLDLVETAPDPNNPRRQIVFLTPKGSKRIARMLSQFTGKATEFDAPRASSFVEAVHRKHMR